MMKLFFVSWEDRYIINIMTSVDVTAYKEYFLTSRGGITLSIGFALWSFQL